MNYLDSWTGQLGAVQKSCWTSGMVLKTLLVGKHKICSWVPVSHERKES